jgi:hypothetical protein
MDERSDRIEQSLRAILEIGKYDMSNPKYNSYFIEALDSIAAPALPPEGMGAQVIGEKLFVYDRYNPAYGWIAERGKDGLFTSLEYGKALKLKADLNAALAEGGKG